MNHHHERTGAASSPHSTAVSRRFAAHLERVRNLIDSQVDNLGAALTDGATNDAVETRHLRSLVRAVSCVSAGLLCILAPPVWVVVVIVSYGLFSVACSIRLRRLTAAHRPVLVLAYLLTYSRRHPLPETKRLRRAVAAQGATLRALARTERELMTQISALERLRALPNADTDTGTDTGRALDQACTDLDRVREEAVRRFSTVVVTTSLAVRACRDLPRFTVSAPAGRRDDPWLQLTDTGHQLMGALLDAGVAP